ncbi:hypothetical protein O6H91_18G076500 [Diphasiastrum complanatum]|nr:hypothetical protein O6H91_18G076500 [Diphasiastrum complanatum]
MAARDGWVLMESPALWASFIVFVMGDHHTHTIPLCLFRFFQLHYVHRTLIYPFRIKEENKGMPIAVIASGFLFNFINAYLQARWISHYGVYPSDWLSSPKFLLGSTVFFVGLVTNIWADSVLLSLRQNSEDRSYKVPKGWLFEFVTCPNYAAEILEWLGWAILTWSPAGLVFALASAGNLIPRAVSHHEWYQKKFSDYPQKRRAIIPFVL